MATHSGDEKTTEKAGRIRKRDTIRRMTKSVFGGGSHGHDQSNNLPSKTEVVDKGIRRARTAPASSKSSDGTSLAPGGEQSLRRDLEELLGKTTPLRDAQARKLAVFEGGGKSACPKLKEALRNLVDATERAQKLLANNTSTDSSLVASIQEVKQAFDKLSDKVSSKDMACDATDVVTKLRNLQDMTTRLFATPTAASSASTVEPRATLLQNAQVLRAELSEDLVAVADGAGKAKLLRDFKIIEGQLAEAVAMSPPGGASPHVTPVVSPRLGASYPQDKFRENPTDDLDRMRRPSVGAQLREMMADLDVSDDEDKEEGPFLMRQFSRLRSWQQQDSFVNDHQQEDLRKLLKDVQTLVEAQNEVLDLATAQQDGLDTTEGHIDQVNANLREGVLDLVKARKTKIKHNDRKGKAASALVAVGGGVAFGVGVPVVGWIGLGVAAGGILTNALVSRRRARRLKVLQDRLEHEGVTASIASKKRAQTG
eukprot:TRINITY_DN7922_c0_g1_i1.p1 TRINITY_DN7922_c0_g1~~TRINITY_DN7922_c0_g1_i1.p1  ORF type:complete len:507 (+),score=114.15 TRINITY_DN7922_c0_g1_i1:73-1521(+)